MTLIVATESTEGLLPPPRVDWVEDFDLGNGAGDKKGMSMSFAPFLRRPAAERDIWRFCVFLREH